MGEQLQFWFRQLRAWRFSHGCLSNRRRVGHFRRTLGRNRVASSRSQKYPSLWWWPPPHARSRLHECHLFRVADGVPMESARRHQILPGLHRTRPLSRMGASGGFLGTVESGSAGIRLLARDRLEVAEHGRVHDESTPGGGKRQAKIRPIEPKAASSAVCWSKGRECPWAWRWTAPTATT